MIGSLIKGGLVIELAGDVGSGKTTLVQGILSGLGFRGETPSPTFTVERVYPVSGGRQAYHLDFYRLQGHDTVTDELAEIMADPQNVVMIEWAGNGDAELPTDRVRITLEPGTTEDSREIRIEALGHTGWELMKGLQHVSRA